MSVVIFFRDRRRLAGAEQFGLLDDERGGFIEAVGVAVGAEKRFFRTMLPQPSHTL